MEQVCEVGTGITVYSMKEKVLQRRQEDKRLKKARNN
jgi:hypothetical protein